MSNQMVWHIWDIIKRLLFQNLSKLDNVNNWNLLMMHTVNVLVEPFWVQDPMTPIENKILNDEVE